MFWILAVHAALHGMFNKLLKNEAVRRLLLRKCPMSSPVKAASRCPHCPEGTPGDNAAWVGY